MSEAAEEQVFKFDQYLVDLDSLIGQLPSATQRQPLLQGGANSPANGTHPVQVKLPKFELATFDGDPLKWASFNDAFASSVDAQNISQVQKLTYLRGFLKGRALQAIEGLPITNENYNVAKNLLVKRFGDDGVVKEALYSQLRRLPPVTRLRALEIRICADELERICRQLEALGENLDQASLSGVVLEKLALAVVLKLEENYKDSSTTTWSLQEIRQALCKLANVQERVARITDQAQQNKVGQPVGSQNKLEHNKEPKRGQFSTEAFPVETNGYKGKQGQRQWQKKPAENSAKREPIQGPFVNSQRKAPSCIFCKQPHYSDECTKYADVQTRRKRLFELNRCYKCLKEGHGSRTRAIHHNVPVFTARRRAYIHAHCAPTCSKWTVAPIRKMSPTSRW
ncbi:MAG: DUF1759 domain-containing protein [Gammaproteobacteria bacterium]|nr:DUF1759 domain-containing protein [Gammaproteobacteria bacterium]